MAGGEIKLGYMCTHRVTPDGAFKNSSNQLKKLKEGKDICLFNYTVSFEQLKHSEDLSEEFIPPKQEDKLFPLPEKMHLK